MTAPVASAGRRLSVVTADQILSSISNVAALIWVAHALHPVDFGRFSLVLMIYLAAQVCGRGLISTAVLVHPEDADERVPGILASTALLGVVAGGLCVAAGLALTFSGSVLGGPTLALGAALPFLLLHDVGRYIAIARREPGRAVVLDSLWIVFMAGGFAAVQVLDVRTLTWLVVAWASSGAVAALWVFVQYGVPRGNPLGWMRERWGFSWRSLVSGMSASGTALMTASLMTLVSSPLAVAGFRAATLLAAPSTAVQLAVATSAAADIAREREDPTAFWRHVRRAIVISTAVGVVNLVVLVFLPDVVGKALLGDAWTVVEPLMLAISLKVLAMSAQSGVRAALIGRHRMQLAMVTDIISIVLIGISMVVGAALGDAEGALWGMAVGTAISTVCWWVAMIWKGRAPAPAAVVATAPAPAPDLVASASGPTSDAPVRGGRHRARRTLRTLLW